MRGTEVPTMGAVFMRVFRPRNFVAPTGADIALAIVYVRQCNRGESHSAAIAEIRVRWRLPEICRHDKPAHPEDRLPAPRPATFLQGTAKCDGDSANDLR